MKKIAILLAALFISTASFACVGKNLVVGTDSTPASKVVAQLLAILINERTGTTVQIVDYDSDDALFKEVSTGDVDLALQYSAAALARDREDVPGDAAAAFDKVKSFYQEKWNLVWLPPLGFTEKANPSSLAAPVAQKHALKKFPALPRLIAKTKEKLPREVLDKLIASDSIPKAVREYLKSEKLI